MEYGNEKVYQEEPSGPVHEGTPRWVALVIVLVAVVAIAGLAVAWTASSAARSERQQLDAVNNDIQTMKQTSTKDMDALQQRLAQAETTNTQLQSDLGVVTKRLQITSGQLNKARAEEAQLKEDSAKQFAAMDTDVKSQLATKANSQDVDQVSGQVKDVRTDLDSTKHDLQMARSDIGTLIAKNHSEIEELRHIGDRDYVEFTDTQKGKPQMVGSVTIQLENTNPKKNQFSLSLVVNDKRINNKDRVINEPIFFYEQGSRQPLELVVNQVAKNKIVGYLSMPKAGAQSASAAGN
jgi:chromosome segregation ATPase